MANERNEFGLDLKNAADVKKEAARSMMPWILSGLVVLAVVVVVVIYGFNKSTGTSSVPNGAVTTPVAR